MYIFQSPHSLEVCTRCGTAGQVCKLTWHDSTWLSPGSRQKSIMILWKYGMGQPVHPHWSESTMARRRPSSSSAQATTCTCSSQLTVAGLMLASSSTMRVSWCWLAPRAGHYVPGDRNTYLYLSSSVKTNGLNPWTNWQSSSFKQVSWRVFFGGWEIAFGSLININCLFRSKMI